MNNKAAAAFVAGVIVGFLIAYAMRIEATSSSLQIPPWYEGLPPTMDL